MSVFFFILRRGSYLVLAHAEQFAPSYQNVLAREWSTEGANRQTLSPFTPTTTKPAPLWPAGHFTEADYDHLRVRAASLLSCPVVPQLLETSLLEQEGYMTLYGPDIATTYEFACRARWAATDEAQATRQRYVQAMFLFNLAYAARHEDQVRFVLHPPASTLYSSSPAPMDPMDPVGQVGQVHVSASPWALAVDGFKLAWALCQPRHGLTLTGTEQCVEALTAINMAKMITVTNPRCADLSTATIFLDPALHSTLAHETDPIKREMYKRVMAHRMWAMRGMDRGTNPFVPLFDRLVNQWGPLTALPMEAREVGLGGVVSRLRLVHFFACIQLVRLTERVLELLSTSPFSTCARLYSSSGSTGFDPATKVALGQLVQWRETHVRPAADLLPLAGTGTFDAYDLYLMNRDRAREFGRATRAVVAHLPSYLALHVAQTTTHATPVVKQEDDSTVNLLQRVRACADRSALGNSP